MKKLNRLFLQMAFIVALISLSVTTSSAKTIKRTLKKGKSTVVTVTTKKKIKKLEVKSSNRKVAAVKKISGKKIRISAKKTGTAKITAKIYKNKKQYSKNVYQIKVKASASAGNGNDDSGVVPKKSHRKVTKVTPVPTKRPRPTRDPAPTATPKATDIPVVSSNYKYEMEILNSPDNLYNDSCIYVYIKTNNPDGNTMDLKGFNTSVSGSGYVFDDVHYDEKENIVWDVGKKVAGGYLAVGRFSNPGHQTLILTETVNNTSSIVASLDLNLSDYEYAAREFSEGVITWATARKQKCEELVKKLLDNSNDDDDFHISSILTDDETEMLSEGLYNRNDTWNEYSCLNYQELREYLELPDEVKLAKMIGAYIYKNYRYQTYTNDGSRKTLYLLSESIENLWWTPGNGLNCWDATALLDMILTQAGIPMEWGIPEWNPMHRYGIIKINEREYKVDAQPRTQTGLISSWNYII